MGYEEIPVHTKMERKEPKLIEENYSKYELYSEREIENDLRS